MFSKKRLSEEVQIWKVFLNIRVIKIRYQNWAHGGGQLKTAKWFWIKLLPLPVLYGEPTAMICSYERKKP